MYSNPYPIGRRIFPEDLPEDLPEGPKQVSVGQLGLPRRRWYSGTTGVLARRRVHALDWPRGHARASLRLSRSSCRPLLEALQEEAEARRRKEHGKEAEATSWALVSRMGGRVANDSFGHYRGAKLSVKPWSRWQSPEWGPAPPPFAWAADYVCGAARWRHRSRRQRQQSHQPRHR